MFKVFLCPSYFRISVMEKRLDQFDKIVSDFIGDSGMAFSVIDNINIYRGTVTHFRIFKKLGPKMWNFTGDTCLSPILTTLTQHYLQTEKCGWTHKNH